MIRRSAALRESGQPPTIHSGPAPCSEAAFQAYTGHLGGVQYDRLRRRGTRADDHLCRLCKASQESAWDHCHEHGHVRGPL
ncbi:MULTISPECIES: endonuclease domain-containing protein [unclassified Streptomyces]|uniref:endonuclease domain-containing protein n=1 Tax=unclassified Streptomyces TaxID=2593676 RepID=UPI0004C6CCE5|nr:MULTISPECIES: endonuclease domain-containing protein [unclassified Streptomyces]